MKICIQQYIISRTSYKKELLRLFCSVICMDTHESEIHSYMEILQHLMKGYSLGLKFDFSQEFLLDKQHYSLCETATSEYINPRFQQVELQHGTSLVFRIPLHLKLLTLVIQLPMITRPQSLHFQITTNLENNQQNPYKSTCKSKRISLQS